MRKAPERNLPVFRGGHIPSDTTFIKPGKVRHLSQQLREVLSLGDPALTERALKHLSQWVYEQLEAQRPHQVLSPPMLEHLPDECHPARRLVARALHAGEIAPEGVINRLVRVMATDTGRIMVCRAAIDQLKSSSRASPRQPTWTKGLMLSFSNWDNFRHRGLPALNVVIKLARWYRQSWIEPSEDADTVDLDSYIKILSHPRKLDATIIKNDARFQRTGADFMEQVFSWSMRFRCNRNGIFLSLDDRNQAITLFLRAFDDQWLRDGIAHYGEIAEPFLKEAEISRCMEIIETRRRGGRGYTPIRPMFWDFGQGQGFDKQHRPKGNPQFTELQDILHAC